MNYLLVLNDKEDLLNKNRILFEFFKNVIYLHEVVKYLQVDQIFVLILNLLEYSMFSYHYDRPIEDFLLFLNLK